MDKVGDVILEALARYHADALRAVAKRDRQIRAAIEVGKRSDEIAAALGCSPNNVRNLKAWKERRRLLDGDVSTPGPRRLYLGLGSSVLRQLGCKTLVDVAEFTADYLLSVRGFGAAALANVRERLGGQGLALAGDPQPPPRERSSVADFIVWDNGGCSG